MRLRRYYVTDDKVAAVVPTDTYDRAGRTDKVTDIAGERTFGYYDTGGGAEDTLDKSARLKTESLPAYFGSHVLTYDYQYGVAGRANGALTGAKLDMGTLYAMTYGYDAVLRMNSVTYNGGTPFTYTYVTNSNLVDTVTQGAAGYLRDYDYEANSNRLATLKHGWGTDTLKGVESRLTYNQLGLRETEKTHGNSLMASLGRTGVHTEYTYNARAELADSGKYQLPGWGVGGDIPGTIRAYEYDAIGNRTSDQGGTYTPNALNQYAAAPGFGAFSYDANGNLKNDGIRLYDYDAENRLIKVTQGGSIWNYSYDYLGRRIAKSGTGLTETRFIYDGWNLIAETDAAGTIGRRFAWGLDVSGSLQGAGGVGGLLTIDAASVHYRPIYDASHNVIALYSASGGIGAAYEYDPFGNVQSTSGSYGGLNPFRSATKYTDAETSLVYYGHRYYSAKLGRFINRDPIEEAGGLNLYGFCGNDGVNRWDYLGMEDVFDTLRRTGGSQSNNWQDSPHNSTLYVSESYVIDNPLAAAKPTGQQIADGYILRRPSVADLRAAAAAAAARGLPDYNFLTELRHFWQQQTSAPNRGTWTDRDRTAAKYASDVYDDTTGGLLNSMGIPYDPKKGFAAGLYLGADGKYYLAMRGTQPTSGANWWANIKQALGFRAPQYEQAVNLARATDRAIAAIGGELVIVGHSLGGGLASAGSYATGRDAITFNAAGLSSRYATGDPGDIRAHYIRGDILSVGQDFSPLPNAAGTRIPHGASAWYRGMGGRHMMDNFLGL